MTTIQCTKCERVVETDSDMWKKMTCVECGGTFEEVDDEEEAELEKEEVFGIKCPHCKKFISVQLETT